MGGRSGCVGWLCVFRDLCLLPVSPASQGSLEWLHSHVVTWYISPFSRFYICRAAEGTLCPISCSLVKGLNSPSPVLPLEHPTSDWLPAVPLVTALPSPPPNPLSNLVDISSACPQGCYMRQCWKPYLSREKQHSLLFPSPTEQVTSLLKAIASVRSDFLFANPRWLFPIITFSLMFLEMASMRRCSLIFQGLQWDRQASPSLDPSSWRQKWQLHSSCPREPFLITMQIICMAGNGDLPCSNLCFKVHPLRSHELVYVQFVQMFLNWYSNTGGNLPRCVVFSTGFSLCLWLVENGLHNR